MTGYAEKTEVLTREVPLYLPFRKMKALPGNIKIGQPDKEESKTDELEIPFDTWTMPPLEPGRIKCPKYDFF